ncbi:MAG TPA: FtsX-like permease family protein [Candidatus Marinimicrobia bacterium]|nr:FtsX-like permease family protein [Candidatus Neomarinimicrobiota bacterium]
MPIYEILFSALSSIRQNKVRSFLTLLGVIIGVFSIIGVMTAINILQSALETNLSVIGSNNFYIQKYPAIQMGGHDRRKYHNRKNLTYTDYQKLKEKVKLADFISAEEWHGGDPVKYGNQQTKRNVTIIGTTPEWEYTSGFFLSEGRMLINDDLSQRRAVALLGYDVAALLFPNEYPIGKQVSIRGKKYNIVGLLDKKGAVFGQSEDNRVVIPITTHLQQFGTPWSSLGYTITVSKAEHFQDAMDEVTYHLRHIRKVPLGEENDFEIVTNAGLLDTFNQVTAAIKLAALLISSIALLAAGIGIMNIMLVTVTERTKEIGIRKSLGARRKSILQQFLLEAIILTMIGGLFGIILGVAAGNILALIMKIKVLIPWAWAFIGLMVTSVIGAVFGTYPAIKASALDPIEALRYE